MDVSDVIDSDSAKAWLSAQVIENVKLAVVDCDGVLRGKYVNRDKFESALSKGFGFCDVIFGWDSQDELYGRDSHTGWATAFPDAWAQIDPASIRALPTEDNQSALFLVDFAGRRQHLAHAVNVRWSCHQMVCRFRWCSVRTKDLLHSTTLVSQNLG